MTTPNADAVRQVSEKAVLLLHQGRTALNDAERALAGDDGLGDQGVLNWLADALDALDSIIVAVEPDGDRYDRIVKAAELDASGAT